MDTDRNLLFAVLALQTDFIDTLVFRRVEQSFMKPEHRLAQIFQFGARFVSDTERQAAAQHDSELLVVVAVLGNGASRVELDNRQRQSFAVHGARGHAVPNLPQIEFVELPERCHVATLLAGRLERLVQVGWQR